MLRTLSAYEVSCLLTTVTEDYDRISMHGVRKVLLEQQAASLGVPLRVAPLPANCSNDDYERAIGKALDACGERGIAAMAAGDLYLEDVRAYREKLVAQHGLKAFFPIWGRDTTELAREFIDSGYKAILTCVDTQALDASFVGRDFNHELLRDLPASIDPCGENGEFHTFVWDGPGFTNPVHCVRGEKVLRDNRFACCDLLPYSERVD
jgi:uncharacterized protein (TIGR00290 family)